MKIQYSGARKRGWTLILASGEKQHVRPGEVIEVSDADGAELIERFKGAFVEIKPGRRKAADVMTVVETAKVESDDGPQ